MGKPLNINRNSSSQTSSNTIIWGGPTIECLDLCKGDTITDVTYKLANKLCNLLSLLDVGAYDLTCLDIAACPPKNIQELLQILIDRICTVQGIEGAAGNDGNYVEVTNVDPGLNCEAGGIRVDVINGVTDMLINSYYVCNGIDGVDGVDGLQGPQGEVGPQGEPGVPGEPGADGICNCAILEGAERGAGDAVYNTAIVPIGEWFDTTIIYSFMTTSLSHIIANGDGTYRFDFQLYMLEESGSSEILAGIRINGTDPTTGIFEVSRIVLSAGNPQPLFFSVFVDVTNGDTVQPDFKVTYQDSATLQMNELKMFITKVD